MSASGNVFLSAMLSAMLLVGCTKDGAIVYLPNPDEEQASTSPLVTVIYGPNSLGDRSYCDRFTGALRLLGAAMPATKAPKALASLTKAPPATTDNSEAPFCQPYHKSSL